MSHRRVIFHIDQEAGRGIRIASTAVVAICIATSISDESGECLGDALASTSDGDVFIGPFAVIVHTSRIIIVVESDEILSMERRFAKSYGKKKIMSSQI